MKEMEREGREGEGRRQKRRLRVNNSERERKVKRATRLVKIEIENGHTTMTIEMGNM